MAKKLLTSDMALFVFILVSLGSIAFVLVSASLSPVEAGKLSSPFGIARMVMVGGLSVVIFLLVKGRRKAVHDQLLLAAFLDNAGDGIFVIDREFIIRLWNRAAEEITGHKADDVVGKPLRDVIAFFRERDRTEDMVFIEEAMLYGERRNMSESMYVVHSDGSEIPVGDSVAPMLKSGGDVSGCIVIFRDATGERKQNALRSEFAYASHQLRTPVTKALWSLEMALDKPAPEKKDLDIAYNALKSIKKLSNEILEVSEIDQDIVHSKGVAVSISEVVGQSLQNNESCIKEHNAVVNTDDIPSGLGVHGDTHLLGRVMDELLCNASQYGKTGATVTVSARQGDNNVVIEVKDDGIGIPEKEQPLVFTKFFRGNNIDTSSTPGAGLGLYIARGYTRTMGGKIWFKSTDRGSTFLLRLPAARPEKVATST